MAMTGCNDQTETQSQNTETHSQDNKPKRESCSQPYDNQNGRRGQSPQSVPHHHPAYAGSVNKERDCASCHGTGFDRSVGSALRGDGEPQSGERNRGSGPEEAGEALGFQQVA